ncbi:MAG: PSD1 and planctomycete cytochrome C domain-containing protein [Planctomycetota bacterium]
MRSWCGFSGAMLLVAGLSAGAVAADGDELFRERVEPILTRRCGGCHSHAAATMEGGLALDSRSGWATGGSRGPAIVPGDPDGSLLIRAVRHADPDLRMPEEGPIPAAEIAILEAWVAGGAADPRVAPPPPADPRDFWSLRPLERPVVPAAATHPVDAFIDARLAAEGIVPAGEVDRRLLARRLFHDLHGLPPTPEAVAAFTADPSLAAWRRLVDDLLASRRHGERWGRYWLDWVRYAETNGYERDSDKPDAWRYRDYVIDAFATDLPYDRFVVEQLAGDEWADEAALPADDARRDRALVATGFLRLHQWDDEPASALQADFDDADDVLGTIGSAFLGLTISCARCHDHKYDPLAQRDYYALLASLRGIEPYGKPHTGGGSRGRGRIQRPLGTAGGALALAVVELPEPPETFVLHRGDAGSPRERVEPGVPAILAGRWAAPPIRPIGTSSGRRLALARWITSPAHPLTARVIANRVWQRHFGSGIVATPDDFGHTGAPPVNQPLLDFLAGELVASGWSLHHLHRIIMASRTYRMTSRATIPAAQAADPDARHFWRQSLRRLDAEAIRDSFLAIAGHLGTKSSGPGVYPPLPDDIRAAANQASFRWPDSPPADHDCRSVYLGVRRAVRLPLLEVLDAPAGSAPLSIRPTTTTAPQALLFLDDPWVHAQATRLRDRVVHEAGADEGARLGRLWSLVSQRSPTAEEAAAAREFLATRRADGGDDAAWAALCHALLGSSEAIYVD